MSSITETVLSGLLGDTAGLSWPMRATIGALLGVVVGIVVPPLFNRGGAQEKEPEQVSYTQTFNTAVTIGPGPAALSSGTINNTFIGPLERHITREQAERFAAHARGHGAPVGIRIQDGSSEARQYFRELATVFETAGWEVRGQDAANTLDGNYKGLVIEVGEPMPKAVATIKAAFDVALIPYEIRRGPWPAGTSAFRLTIWPSH
jgi:hypothetical protein